MQNLELLKKAKNGDTQAFGELYDLFADRIFRFIHFKIQDKAHAEDLLQEIFIRAWRGMATFRIEADANFTGWIYKIAQNATNDQLRKMYRNPESLELDENMAVSESGSNAESLDKKIEFESVREAFEYLPVQYKQILELRYVQDLTVQEVCKITGKTALAVRLAQHRALKQLRKIIGEKYDLGYEKI